MPNRYYYQNRETRRLIETESPLNVEAIDRMNVILIAVHIE